MRADRDPATWVDYWDADKIFRPLMEGTAKVFFRESRRLLEYQANDVVLDFGCGPGCLVEALKDRVGEIHGIDTSPTMIQTCRARFQGQDNLEFSVQDGSRYTDLSLLGGRRFTLIICLSVVQYFHRIEDLGLLVDSMIELCAPGARILVADIPVGGSPILDALELLRSAAAEDLLIEALGFIGRSRFSDYYRTRRSRGMLHYPLQHLHALAEALSERPGVESQVLLARLTLNRRRAHLLIRKER